jgi:hypothetical protein
MFVRQQLRRSTEELRDLLNISIQACLSYGPQFACNINEPTSSLASSGSFCVCVSEEGGDYAPEANGICPKSFR